MFADGKQTRRRRRGCTHYDPPPALKAPDSQPIFQNIVYFLFFDAQPLSSLPTKNTGQFSEILATKSSVINGVLKVGHTASYCLLTRRVLVGPSPLSIFFAFSLRRTLPSLLRSLCSTVFILLQPPCFRGTVSVCRHNENWQDTLLSTALLPPSPHRLPASSLSTLLLSTMNAFFFLSCCVFFWYFSSLLHLPLPWFPCLVRCFLGLFVFF